KRIEDDDENEDDYESGGTPHPGPLRRSSASL
ncbi:MAG: hypothetical protein K0Q55_3028, partial [Verrucomicrobia bacterium]|nr:hypothetical protein [Verrucomicrobiota bacterium]